MRTYLINLDSREDRLESACHQLASLEVTWERIQAIDKIFCTDNHLLQSGVSACWRSHIETLKRFLQSGESHCLIVEDDLIVVNPRVVNDYLNSDLTNVDFLQIGFLKGTIGRRLDIIGANFYNHLLRLLSVLIKYTWRYDLLERKLLLREIQSSPKNSVAANVKAGTHAYIISKTMAAEVIRLNSPQFLAADDFYIALSHMRIFKMFRTRKSYVRQSNSPSSVL